MTKCPACGKPVIGLFCQAPGCNGKAPKKPATGYRTFEEWKAAVNRSVMAICGLGADDLPDYDYYMAWKANFSPEKVAKAALKAAGFPS